jgi:hypothetical protein
LPTPRAGGKPCGGETVDRRVQANPDIRCRIARTAAKKDLEAGIRIGLVIGPESISPFATVGFEPCGDRHRGGGHGSAWPDVDGSEIVRVERQVSGSNVHGRPLNADFTFARFEETGVRAVDAPGRIHGNSAGASARLVETPIVRRVERLDGGPIIGPGKIAHAGHADG